MSGSMDSGVLPSGHLAWTNWFQELPATGIAATTNGTMNRLTGRGQALGLVGSVVSCDPSLYRFSLL